MINKTKIGENIFFSFSGLLKEEMKDTEFRQGFCEEMARLHSVGEKQKARNPEHAPKSR